MKQPLRLITIKKETSQNPKPAVLLMSGIRPRDNCSSFVTTSLIQGMLAENSEGKCLLDLVDIYIYSEINPDGRIFGNFTNSVSGSDLMLVDNCSKVMFPELHYWEKSVKDLSLKQEVVLSLVFSDSFEGLANKEAPLLSSNLDGSREEEHRSAACV